MPAGRKRVTPKKKAPAKRAGAGKSPLTNANLRLIWHERRISRADIARRTGLSRSTVSESVDALMPTGLIEEVGAGPSRGGRPPIVIEFRDDAFGILGVDMGAAHVSVVLTDLRGRVIAWEHRSHSVRTDPDGTRALIMDLCDRCLSTWSGGLERMVGIGIAVPCPVDPRHPELFSEVVLPEWGGVSGFSAISERYGLPLMVDNDANLGALAERWWGAGRAVDDFAYIKVATGVGSGHVIRGHIYRGATGVAGEIGHLAIDPNGDVCICGLRGCLGTIIGAAALVKRARALRDRFPQSALNGAALTVDAIEDAGLAGDPLALAVVREAAEHLGVAIAGLVNLMNPELVIIGGGIARLGEALLDPLRETIKKRTLISSLSVCNVTTSELGTQATAVGAATMILEAALADSALFPTVRRRRARR